jgi:hypothetical protein
MKNQNDSGIILSLAALVGVCVFVFIAWQIVGVPLLHSQAVQILIHAFGG